LDTPCPGDNCAFGKEPLGVVRTESGAKVAYRASRLHFKAEKIEPLRPEDRFRIDTPHGSFEMSKAEFYRDFPNVVTSRSYKEKGSYHYLKVPKRALRYRTGDTAVPEEPTVRSKNRRLTAEELANLFAPLLKDVRSKLLQLSGGDATLQFALRRKLFKELTYDERSKPMQRRALKRKKIIEQEGRCAICQTSLPAKGAVLDRFEAMPGYIPSNVRVLCPSCDVAEQEKKKYG
jgi:hypothetical protein